MRNVFKLIKKRLQILGTFRFWGRFCIIILKRVVAVNQNPYGKVLLKDAF